MFNIPYLRSASVISVLLLALPGGCGGSADGGGGPDPWTAPAADYYQSLDSTSATTNAFGGVGIRSNDDSDTIDVAQSSGSVEHSTGSLTISDTNYTMVDPNGFSGGVATDGVGGTLNETSGAYTGTYEYVMPATFSYTASGIAYTTIGFAGITTESTHVPISGNATYTGESVGNIITTSDFYDLAGGVSSIYVDFGASNVDVTLNGFTATDAQGAAATAPLDTIKITGMAIAGNEFTGGALEALLSSATVDITGANTSTSSEGLFFGWDSIGVVPDEVAGVSVTVGDEGMMLFSFVGD